MKSPAPIIVPVGKVSVPAKKGAFKTHIAPATFRCHPKRRAIGNHAAKFEYAGGNKDRLVRPM